MTEYYSPAELIEIFNQNRRKFRNHFYKWFKVMGVDYIEDVEQDVLLAISQRTDIDKTYQAAGVIFHYYRNCVSNYMRQSQRFPNFNKLNFNLFDVKEDEYTEDNHYQLLADIKQYINQDEYNWLVDYSSKKNNDNSIQAKDYAKARELYVRIRNKRKYPKMLWRGVDEETNEIMVEGKLDDLADYFKVSRQRISQVYTEQKTFKRNNRRIKIIKLK